MKFKSLILVGILLAASVPAEKLTWIDEGYCTGENYFYEVTEADKEYQRWIDVCVRELFYRGPITLNRKECIQRLIDTQYRSEDNMMETNRCEARLEVYKERAEQCREEYQNCARFVSNVIEPLKTAPSINITEHENYLELTGNIAEQVIYIKSTGALEGKVNYSEVCMGYIPPIGYYLRHVYGLFKNVVTVLMLLLMVSMAYFIWTGKHRRGENPA